MKCQVIKPFTRRGEMQHPGCIIEVPENALVKLTGYVEPLGTADTYQPDFKVWLTESGELRTSGLCDDLAAEIVRLTAGNLGQQKTLLLLHCQRYDCHHFPALADEWAKRAAIMQYDGGLSRYEAECKAAERLRLQSFLDELRGTP